jgi:hypothetical protein
VLTKVMAELQELASNPHVSPPWILSGEANHEIPEFRGSRRPSSACSPPPSSLGGHELAMQSQERVALGMTANAGAEVRGLGLPAASCPVAETAACPSVGVGPRAGDGARRSRRPCRRFASLRTRAVGTEIDRSDRRARSAGHLLLDGETNTLEVSPDESRPATRNQQLRRRRSCYSTSTLIRILHPDQSASELLPQDADSSIRADPTPRRPESLDDADLVQEELRTWLVRMKDLRGRGEARRVTIHVGNDQVMTTVLGTHVSRLRRWVVEGLPEAHDLLFVAGGQALVITQSMVERAPPKTVRS